MYLDNFYINNIENENYFDESGFGNILYLKKDGIIKKVSENLLVTLALFNESQKHHTYFNRKLYIGKNGEIKNAPECEEEFGNIHNIRDVKELKQIISQPEFQKYWFVSPDMIDVTKDSEFRYMSIDNRIPHQRKDGSWYYKEESSYNPYICKWKGEEGYLTLEECGVVVNEEGYSRDDAKITAINDVLWAD